MAIASINVNELAANGVRGQPIELIDVRTPAEFAGVHAAPARNVPLDQLDPAAVLRQHGNAGGPLYVICQKGGRGRQACERLAQAGFAHAINVEGGTDAWVAAGLPTVHDKPMMALERQVRIAAGSMMLAGLALSYIHPAFLGLSAFVGAGLVFSGVTDTCGMGMVLAKMPWNRGESCSSHR